MKMAEYSSNGKGNLGVTLGAIGTGLGLLGGMGDLGAGLLGGGATTYEDRHVTRHELDLIREIMEKDQRIAIADSENYTDKKLVEVYTALNKSDREIRDKIDANYKEQVKINTDQAVYNGVNSSTLNCMQSRIDELLALTARRVPNTSVCPGWGPVTVTPGGGTTTA